MAVCDPQELLDAGKCYVALDSHTRKVLLTQMLCNWASADPVTCDIQELLDDAQCLFPLSDVQLEVIQLQLLCNILGP